MSILQMMNKNANINYSSAMEMTRKYPFQPTEPEALIKCTRNFKENEYLELRSRIETHSKLKHNCLIRIVKAYQSKKNKYFDIFYQRIPHSLRNIVFDLSYQQLILMRQQLLNFCSYLIYLGIYPIVAEELLGVTKQKTIKLFLDVDYIKVTGNYQNLVKAKTIQIYNVFKIYEEIAQRNYRIRPDNLLERSTSPRWRQQTPIILTVQHNVHHNVSPPYQVDYQMKKQKVNLRQTKSNINIIPGFDYLRSQQVFQSTATQAESPQPTTNFSQAPSRIWEMQRVKSLQNLQKSKDETKTQKQIKFERKFSTKTIPINQQQTGTARLKSQSLRHTFNNDHKQKVLSKNEQLRISFDRLSSKLVRLQLALGDENERDKIKEIRKEETLNNIKTGRMHLEEMENVVSEDDNQETKLEMNNPNMRHQFYEKSENCNKKDKQKDIERQKTPFEKIYEKVKNAIEKTESTFRKYEQAKTK